MQENDNRLHPALNSNAQSASLCGLHLQIPHRRSANTAWKLKSAGLFGKGKVLTVETTRAVRKGEALAMDYAPDKLDNAVLLDHGVLDARNPKVGLYHLGTISKDLQSRWPAGAVSVLVCS